MKLSIIAAVNNNGIIGDSSFNGLLWNCPADLKNFKKTTLDSYIIMGRKTWESLECIYLPKRLNAVISRDCDDLNGLYDEDMLKFFGSIDCAIEYIEMNKIEGFKDEIFFIGGLSIYKGALKKKIDAIYLSKISNDSLGDLAFPPLPDDFKLKSSESLDGFILEIYERI